MANGNTIQHKATIKATAWSHVHIASGRTIERWDYFFHNKKLWFLDEEKLAQVASKDNRLIDEMTKCAAARRESLNSFLQKDPSLRERLRLANSDRQVSESILRQEIADPKIRNIKLFAGSPNCYIPGSSIKGAIRTAIISELVSKGKLQLNQNLETLHREIMKGFALDSKETQFFKNLLVSDSKILDSKNLAIASVQIYASSKKQVSEGRSKHDHQRYSVDNDTYCELLVWDSPFEFKIELRPTSLVTDFISIHSIPDLLEVVNKFSRRIWRKERENRKNSRFNSQDIIDFYNDEPRDDCYLLRLGYGSGQLSTSLLHDYQDTYDGLDQGLRQGRVYTPKFTRETGRDLRKRRPYPYTAKSALATHDGYELQAPLGWVKILRNQVVEHAN